MPISVAYLIQVVRIWGTEVARKTSSGNEQQGPQPEGSCRTCAGFEVKAVRKPLYPHHRARHCLQAVLDAASRFRRLWALPLDSYRETPMCVRIWRGVASGAKSLGREVGNSYK